MTTANEILKLAQNEIGTREKGKNNVKYNTLFYGGAVNGNEFDWCVVFIWWLFKKANASKLFCSGIKTAYVPYVYNYAKRNKLLKTKGKKGDLAIITWGNNSADHIGIVESVNGDTYTTIEGNTNGAYGQGVYRKTRKSSNILGFYSPKYKAEKKIAVVREDKCKVELKILRRGSKGAQVKTLQRILYCYFGCPDDLLIDGDYGTITKNYVVKIQRLLKIPSDGVCDQNTWTALLNLG